MTRRGTSWALTALAAATIASASACTPDASKTWGDATVSQAFSYTEWAPDVVSYCGRPVPVGVRWDPLTHQRVPVWDALPALTPVPDAMRGGFCEAITDEPTLQLQRVADEGYNLRIKLALDRGFKP